MELQPQCSIPFWHYVSLTAAAPSLTPTPPNNQTLHPAEARGGLHVVEQSLWAAVPDFLRRLSTALKKHTGRELPLRATPIKFGSWMGGDRDGNPNVTAKTTHHVVALSRRVPAARGRGRQLLAAEPMCPQQLWTSWMWQGCIRLAGCVCRTLILALIHAVSQPIMPRIHVCMCPPPPPLACCRRWMAADLYLREVDILRFEVGDRHSSA